MHAEAMPPWLGAVQACRTGVHHAAASLHLASWHSLQCSLKTAQEDVNNGNKSPGCGVELVLEHKEVVGPEQSQAGPPVPHVFPGLYSPTLSATFLPTQPFWGSASIFVNTLWHECAAVVAVDLKNGGISRLTPPDACYTLLATTPTLLAERSSLVQPSAVAAAHPPGPHKKCSFDGVLPWTILGPSIAQNMTDIMQSIAYTTHCIPRTTPTGSIQPESACNLPALLLSPLPAQGRGGVARAPAVLFLHGGPHAAATCGWAAPLVSLAAAGYVIILPNYRGSSGYGESHLQALPGHIGSVCAILLEPVPVVFISWLPPA
jgi:hypothetical protein